MAKIISFPVSPEQMETETVVFFCINTLQKLVASEVIDRCELTRIFMQTFWEDTINHGQKTSDQA